MKDISPSAIPPPKGIPGPEELTAESERLVRPGVPGGLLPARGADQTPALSPESPRQGLLPRPRGLSTVQRDEGVSVLGRTSFAPRGAARGQSLPTPPWPDCQESAVQAGSPSAFRHLSPDAFPPGPAQPCPELPRGPDTTTPKSRAAPPRRRLTFSCKGLSRPASPLPPPRPPGTLRKPVSLSFTTSALTNP